jgi:hypothetical protein
MESFNNVSFTVVIDSIGWNGTKDKIEELLEHIKKFPS